MYIVQTVDMIMKRTKPSPNAEVKHLVVEKQEKNPPLDGNDTMQQLVKKHIKTTLVLFISVETISSSCPTALGLLTRVSLGDTSF
jgi:hypothetical protein